MKRALLASFLLATPALAIDEQHEAKARAMADRAIAYLRAQQDEKTGGWAIPPEGPHYPAITGLIVNGMLMHDGITADDPAMKSAIAYLLGKQQPDGGIYDRILPSYNTSISLSALARVKTPAAIAAIKPAQDFLRSLQFGEGAAVDGQVASETGRVGKDHPFYGGVGYGNHGRPDNSNLTFFIQAMHDSGVTGEDPAMQRALVFLARTQMLDAVNDMPYADGSRQGGFIYATSENRDKVGSGQSQAGVIEETLDDGTNVSRLRAYGSMTYAGFKSYIYAQLPPTDPRVTAAFDWITRNYTVEENPGAGTDGFYYYLVTFARALEAAGRGPTPLVRGHAITVISADGAPTERDWANDLIDRLAELQNEDGSFRSIDDRWMENNPILITAYSLLAIEHALE
jgi:squalene-hopene/tetraprenyl-beta-curcumene cyclase